MRKGNCGFAMLAIVLGVIIILAIVLPAQFWWFMLAAGLICCGIHFYRCR